MRPNGKVTYSGQEPGFAPFHGYSLLFDNLPESYKDSNGLLWVDCKGASNARFYEKLFAAFENVTSKQMWKNFSLCALPANSAHCTALDGNNSAALDSIHSERRGNIENLIRGLPESFVRARSVVKEFYDSKLANERWEIDFVFDALDIWNTALVAKLKPADEAAATRLSALRVAREGFRQEEPKPWPK